MCIYVYVCLYMCIYMYICTHTYVDRQIYIHMCIHTHTHIMPASCMHSIARSPAAACVAVGVPCHLHLLYLCYSSVLHVCNIVSVPLFLSNIARVQGVGCGVSPNLDVSQEDALADLHARNVELERLGYLLAAAHHLHLGGPQKNRTGHRKTTHSIRTGEPGADCQGLVAVWV